MEWSIVISIICIIVAIFCIIKLQRKQYLDRKERNDLDQEVQGLKNYLSFYQNEIAREQQRFQDLVDENNKMIAQKATAVDNFYEQAKARRLKQLEDEMNRAKKALENDLNNENEKIQSRLADLEQTYLAAATDCDERIKKIEDETHFQEERYSNLLAPLQQYEKEKMEKLFYTIQVPDEYRGDINFLLTNVSPKIQHPDIVNKLIWAEYIKPYLDETFKRVGIEAKPGIYKITNIDDGKCYIGKSTDIKKRLADHFKSSIGISSIADQAVHHAILKQGVWNWAIEPIIYCEKDKLNELEKYYINFFKSQEYGFNKNAGGGG